MHLLEVFSKRRAEIESWLASNGRADTRRPQDATLATRRGKPDAKRAVDAGWKREKRSPKVGPDQAERLIVQATQTVAADPVGEVWRLAAVGFDESGDADHYERTVEPEEWIADLLRRELTQTSTTFTRFELTEAVAARIGTGATVATIDRVVARVLASDQVIAVHEPDTPAPRGRARYTSRDMLAVEQRLLAAFTATNTNQPLTADIVESAIADRITIGVDQAAAVRTLCAAPDRWQCSSGGDRQDLHARHGPRRLRARRLSGDRRRAISPGGDRTAHWREHPVTHPALVAGCVGTLPRATNELHRGGDRRSGNDRRSTPRAEHQPCPCGWGTGGLVGDHHQLPEIDAGGRFSAATDAGTVAELTVNRRQHAPWEQDALAELRAGNITIAVRAYLDHDRVAVADDRQQMVETAIDRWQQARGDGRHVVLLAGTNELVDVLNDAARRQLVNNGELAADLDGHYGHRGYRIGERIVLRRNSDRARTLDAQQVTVASSKPASPGSAIYALRHPRQPTRSSPRRDLSPTGASTTPTPCHNRPRRHREQAITSAPEGLSKSRVRRHVRGQHQPACDHTPEAEQTTSRPTRSTPRPTRHTFSLRNPVIDDELVDTFERSRWAPRPPSTQRHYRHAPSPGDRSIT